MCRGINMLQQVRICEHSCCRVSSCSHFTLQQTRLSRDNAINIYHFKIITYSLVQVSNFLFIQPQVTFRRSLKLSLLSDNFVFFSHKKSMIRARRGKVFAHNMIIWYFISPGTGGTHQYLDPHALVVMGLGRLTCFVRYCVGFGHRLLITQVDRGAPLKNKIKMEKLFLMNDTCHHWANQEQSA